MVERWTAHRIALIYAAFSVAWIILSDRVLALLVPDLTGITVFQTIKGLFFVCSSALLVFALIRQVRTPAGAQGNQPAIALREDVRRVLPA